MISKILKKLIDHKYEPSDFLKNFDKLQKAIERHRIETLANVEHKDIIVSGLKWLINSQNSEGFWGDHNQTGTSLSILVLKLWSQTALPEFSQDDACKCIKLGVKWLQQCFSDTKNTFPKIWMRSLSLSVINNCGYWDSFFDEELKKLIADANQGSISITFENAHHYAKLMILLKNLQKVDELNIIGEKFSEFILTMEKPEIYSEYFLGEILQGYMALERRSETLKEKTDEIIKHIELFVKTAIIDSWSFVPYCSSLIALGDQEREGAKSLIANRYFKIFREGGRGEDGSFYYDVHKTCWALLALNRIREVHRISMPLYFFRENFINAERNFQALIEKLRVLIVKLILFMSAYIIIILVWLKIDIVKGFPLNLLAFVLGGISLLVGGKLFYLIRKLVKLLSIG